MQTLKEKDISSKHFLEYMRTPPLVSFEKSKTKRMNGLDEAIKDIEEGRVTSFNNMEDLKKHFDSICKEALNEI